MPERSPPTGTGALTLARALFVIAVLGIFIANFGGLRPAASAAVDEKSIQELEDQLTEAVLHGDVGTFERLFADDFTHTSQDGTFRTRAAWLKGRVPGKTNYVSYEIDDRRIRIYGETAVVTGLLKASWSEVTGVLASGRFRFLRVWVKGDERWQAVAFQSTRISEKEE
jgi:hypothetical protein